MIHNAVLLTLRTGEWSLNHIPFLSSMEIISLVDDLKTERVSGDSLSEEAPPRILQRFYFQRVTIEVRVQLRSRCLPLS